MRDFRLPDPQGKIHTLSEHRGKRAVILSFYPQALTSGCKTQCLAIQASLAELQRYQVQIYGVSVDPVEANRKFTEENRFTFPLLSDPEKQFCRAIGMLNPTTGKAKRVALIVDTAGKVLRILDPIRPAPHGRDLLQALEELKIPKSL